MKLQAKWFATLLFLALAAGQTPAHAFFGDEAILSMQYAEDKTFHAFMQLQVVQEIATLKANYDASVRYYSEFKQLNSGKGLFQNLGAEIKVAQDQENEKIEQELNQTFVQPSQNTNTATDDLFQALDHAIAGNIKYAGDEMANVISDRKAGVSVSQNAEGLSPKDAANLTAKAQGLQLQMLAGIHEDNLRMLQLQSMTLSRETRRDESEAGMIQDIRASLQRRGLQTNDGTEAQ
ncbi:MAG: hypothetical protein KGJ84_02115 [Elusimicrobia bacterium]|nr:hypothetical protein [Elusimicrobiota bacterium]